MNSQLPVNVLEAIDDFDSHSLTYLSSKSLRELVTIKSALVYFQAQRNLLTA